MVEMTKMERVRAAVAGKPVDRVPFVFWHHFRPHGNPHKLAQATVDFFGDFDLDIYKIMPDIPYPFRVNSIRSADDWLLVSKVDPYEDNLGRMVETVELVKAEVGDDVPVLVTVFSPFTYAMRFAGGADAIRQHIRENPVEVHAALGVLSRNIAGFCEAAINVGADGVFFAVQGAGDSILTPTEYGEFARPYDLHCLRAAAGGWLTTLHVHASSGLDITPFLAYPAPVLSWSDRLTGISLREVRAKAPAKCLMGGISERGPITNGTKEAIAAEMRDALNQVGKERFILANGCSVPDDNPESLLRAAREALDDITQS